MTLPSWRLDGQKALITGASSGLGVHFAHALALSGAEVVLAARRTELLQQVVDDIIKLGGKAHAVTLDVSNAQSVSACFNEAESLVGSPIDIVLNNAGVGSQSLFVNLGEAEWDAAIDINLKGTYLVSHEATQRLVKAGVGGSIINIASLLGIRVSSGVSAYCASKAGVIQLTKAMALELARHKIRVNAIAPGYVLTDINRSMWDTDYGQQMIKRIPQRRLGEAQELIGPLLLLASQAGSYMTGTVIEVDGGHLCSGL